MIRKVYSKRNRDGWHFDTKRRLYWSWKFDIRYRDAQGRERRKKQSGFVNEAEARLAAANFQHAALQTRYGIAQVQPSPSLAQLVTKRIEQITSHHEQVRATRLLNALLVDCGRLLPVDELHSSHLLKFVERLRSEKLSPATINRDLNTVSAALNAAPTYFPALSQWRAPRIPRPKQSKRRRERVIKLEEVARLLTWLYRDREPGESARRVQKRRNVGHVFRLALLTASRKGEICKLRWDQIDWQAGVFQIIGTKTEHSQPTTARYPKLTNTIAEILRERRAIVPQSCRYVFTSNGGEVTHYYDTMQQATRACGLLYGRNVLGGFVTHDTRHTAVTYLMQAGHDIKTIGALTGHSDKTMVLLYSHASQKSVNAACDALESLAGTGTFGLDLDSVTKSKGVS